MTTTRRYAFCPVYDEQDARFERALSARQRRKTRTLNTACQKRAFWIFIGCLCVQQRACVRVHLSRMSCDYPKTRKRALVRRRKEEKIEAMMVQTICARMCDFRRAVHAYLYNYKLKRSLSFSHTRILIFTADLHSALVHDGRIQAQQLHVLVSDQSFLEVCTGQIRAFVTHAG